MHVVRAELSRRQTHAALEVISGAFSSYSASQGVQTRCIAAAAATQQASISAPDLPPPSQAPSAQTFGIRSRQLTRSGYREYLVKSEDAPSALAHRVALKVPLGETEGQADDMQPRTVSSPPDEDAETREAFEVLRKLVGCLTKDGRKAPAQVSLTHLPTLYNDGTCLSLRRESSYDQQHAGMQWLQQFAGVHYP